MKKDTITISELEVDSVVHHYGTKKILTDIYLQCKTGDIVGLLGRNGTGKSTLLKIIFGTLKARNANIRINKIPYPATFKSKGKIAYLPQHDFYPAGIKVKKMITTFIQDKQEQALIMNDERIQTLLSKRLRVLSGGERKYLSVLLLLHLKTDFLLLDEPFANIEPLYRERIKEKLTAFSPHQGIIITDHDYENVLDIATKLIVLINGKNYTVKEKDDLVKFGYIPEPQAT